MTDIIDSFEKPRAHRESDLSWPVAPIPPDLEKLGTPEVKNQPSPLVYDELVQLIEEGMKTTEGWRKYKVLLNGEWKPIGFIFSNLESKKFNLTDEERRALRDIYIPKIREHDGPAIDHSKNFGQSVVEAATRVTTNKPAPAEAHKLVHGTRAPDWGELAGGDFERDR